MKKIILNIMFVSALVLLALTVLAVGPGLAATSGTWTLTGSLNTVRVGHTATLLPNGEVLVVGGHSVSMGATAELYNPATGTWIFTGSMATARAGHTATLLPNGEVLVVGGSDAAGNVLASAELYDPGTGRWRNTSSMTTSRTNQGAVLLPSGEVLAAGGVTEIANYLQVINSAELYDPSLGTWTATGSMNIARAMPATLLQDGRVLVAGGGYTYTAELYSDGKWTFTSNMKFNHGGSAALLANGDVLIFGGNLASYAGQFYNPATNIWAATRNIGVKPPQGPLTLLNTGIVLLAGGESGYGTDALCRLYDSNTNSWLFTGSMHQARTGHTATLLQNGQVLVAGGEVKNSTSGFTILGSAEIYTP
jgi:N-acetylneuraminic acid mutarotase